MGKITLHDIAEKANVSAVTVSNVLNHKGKVSEQKRKEIEARARNMGYRPDSIAKSFRRRSSNIIGIVLSHEYPESTSAILSGAIGEAKLREQMILLSPDFRTPEEELSAIKYLVSSPIDALIYYPRNYQVDISRIIGLSSIPIVGMLRRNFGFSIPRI